MSVVVAVEEPTTEQGYSKSISCFHTLETDSEREVERFPSVVRVRDAAKVVSCVAQRVHFFSQRTTQSTSVFSFAAHDADHETEINQSINQSPSTGKGRESEERARSAVSLWRKTYL